MALELALVAPGVLGDSAGWGVASGLGEGGKTDPRHGEYSTLSKQRRVGKQILG